MHSYPSYRTGRGRIAMVVESYWFKGENDDLYQAPLIEGVITSTPCLHGNINALNLTCLDCLCGTRGIVEGLQEGFTPGVIRKEKVI